jgi:hypothetical protein
MPIRFPIVAAALVVSGVAHAAFTTCPLVNHAIDTGADNLGFVRVAARSDGRPLLVYTTDVHNASALNLFDCDDARCASGQLIPLDASYNYFNSPGIVIRADGRPALTSSWYGGVRYYDCLDASCTSVNYNTIVANDSAIFSDMPIALQPSGNPAFLYVDANISMSPRPGYLIVHFCADIGCTTGSERTLATPAENSAFSNLSLAIDADGHVAATYLQSEGASNLYTYNLARCADTACASVTNTTISSPVGRASPFRTAVAIRSSRFPLALDSQSTNTALLDCTTSSCSTFNDDALPIVVGSEPIGLGLLDNDIPSFALFTSGNVGAFACADASCTSGASVSATNTTQSILEADFALDPAQRPLIAYIDFDTRKLSAAGCDTLFADGFEP